MAPQSLPKAEMKGSYQGNEPDNDLYGPRARHRALARYATTIRISAGSENGWMGGTTYMGGHIGLVSNGLIHPLLGPHENAQVLHGSKAEGGAVEQRSRFGSIRQPPYDLYKVGVSARWENGRVRSAAWVGGCTGLRGFPGRLVRRRTHPHPHHLPPCTRGRSDLDYNAHTLRMRSRERRQAVSVQGPQERLAHTAFPSPSSLLSPSRTLAVPTAHHGKVGESGWVLLGIPPPRLSSPLTPSIPPRYLPSKHITTSKIRATGRTAPTPRGSEAGEAACEPRASWAAAGSGMHRDWGGFPPFQTSAVLSPSRSPDLAPRRGQGKRLGAARGRGWPPLLVSSHFRFHFHLHTLDLALLAEATPRRHGWLLASTIAPREVAKQEGMDCALSRPNDLKTRSTKIAGMRSRRRVAGGAGGSAIAMACGVSGGFETLRDGVASALSRYNIHHTLPASEDDPAHLPRMDAILQGLKANGHAVINARARGDDSAASRAGEVGEEAAACALPCAGGVACEWRKSSTPSSSTSSAEAFGEAAPSTSSLVLARQPESVHLAPPYTQVLKTSPHVVVGGGGV
ncbi:hypothetical protein CVT26_007713 [Gymnopilus dilepis]|uniref:Uncharacterized protein n=1 Tax=Gymnopilus dilepis TaxID=231916 RepID=A0A409WWR2_9AGAR|nr:hypothetical protein CVT26_007713 [Gymnopilus dilepis]